MFNKAAYKILFADHRCLNSAARNKSMIFLRAEKRVNSDQSSQKTAVLKILILTNYIIKLYCSL